MKPHKECAMTALGTFRRFTRRLLGQEDQTDGWGHYTVGAGGWERQYRDGAWDYMRGLPEIGRYSVIIGYLRHFALNGRVLDLGCGEGILTEQLGPHSYGALVGVDISGTAIATASSRGFPKAVFVQADINQYEPDGLFDAVVLNEVIYYTPEPLPVLHRVVRALKPGGVLIISMYVNDRTRNNWAAIEDAYPPLDETTTTHTSSGNTWVCRVWQKT
jgi:SAM-dependent methyltransferase